MFTLYHFPLCPFSRQVRIYLKEQDKEFTLIKENYWEYNENFAKLNPSMEVPVLITQDENIIASNNGIMEYLIEIEKDNLFFSNDIQEKAEIRRLISWFNEKFYHEVTKFILNEKIIRFYMNQGEPNSSALRAAKANLLQHIEYIAYLINKRKWLAGEKITIADFVAASHISILDYLGTMIWTNNHIKDWYSIVKSRPSFREILLDKIPGFTPTKDYSNLDF